MFPIVLVSDRRAFIGHNINKGVAAAIDRSGSLMVIVKKWLAFLEGNIFHRALRRN